MLLSEKIDLLIINLQALKPKLSNDNVSGITEFNNILNDALNVSNDVNDRLSAHNIEASSIETWHDLDYSYDSANPRKPNMRELMEAISGENLEELYQKPKSEWENVSKKASEMLYGVLGNKEDTRNWTEVMSSKDILGALQNETESLHKPVVDIITEKDTDGLIANQYAVIKAETGEVLRKIGGNSKQVKETLEVFGISKSNLPSNFDQKIVPAKFDSTVLQALVNLIRNEKAASVEKIVTKTTREVISSNFSPKIPVDEMAKL